MALRLEDHVFQMLENQASLYDFLGEHRWDFDMDAGSVVFSSEASGGGLLGRFLSKGPKVLATCPVQLIGSESEGDNTWLWAWANAQSEIPKKLTRGVERIRDEARTQGQAPFFDAGPVPCPRPRYGAELAIICAGHLGLLTYYACSYPGGVLYVAIAEAPAGARRQRDARGAIHVLGMGISALAFDHRPAVLAYLGEPSRSKGDALEWDVGPERVQVAFDAQGRIAQMQTRPGRPT